jgi:hypothetical protein
VPTLTISHAKSNTIADFTGTVTGWNSSGGTATVLATDLVRPSDWNSSHLFTFAADLASAYEPFPLHNTNSTLSAPGNGTWYFDPVFLPAGLASGHIRFYLSQGVSSACFQNGAIFTTNSTGSVSRFQTIYNRFAIYRQGTGASTTQLTTVYTANCDLFATQEMRVTTSTNSAVTASHYLTISIPNNWDASGGSTYSTFTGSGTVSSTTTTTIAASIGSATIATPRNYLTAAFMPAVGLSASLSPGLYYFAHMISSTSSTAGTNYGAGTMFSTISRMGLLENNLPIFKQLGSTVSDTSSQFFPFHGFLATTTSNASSAVQRTAMRGTTGRMYWNHAALSMS